METKERKERLNKLLHDLAASDSLEAKWVRELFALQAEDAKERLVDAMGDDIPRIQGEAKVMERISRQLVSATALLNQVQQPPN
jgi:hypothetical protein